MKYIYITLIAVFITLFLVAYRSCEAIKKYEELYNRELANVEAYEQKNAGLEGEIREFRYTIDELRASKDSINQKLLEASDELKIKDKNIKYLQYQASVMQKTDTIVLKGDTIFREKAVPVDTTIGDNWYNMNLKLQFPSTIVVSPTFRSEKYIIVHNRKEYNKKPSKIFFIRWFQKKHWVTEVTVVEKNPYVTDREQKYIEITK